MTSSSTATLTVAILAGGRSSEHEVSLSSAGSVRDGLLAGGHEVQWVEIGEDGAWRHDGRDLQLRPGAGLLGADVVFPALHGPFGEDGTVQGVLETLDVAYVGAGVTASALCMNKVLFKRLLRAADDVPQVRFTGVQEEHFAESPAQVREEVASLGLPAFVKPAHLGSSLGIARVDEAARLDDAIEAAFAHDALVIVEAMATGIEVECAVLGRLGAEREAGAGAAMASDPGEIVLPGGWYDFHSKYSPGGMQLRVPARISQSAAERVRALAVRVFTYTGCEGLARVDFFVDGENVLVNELNTMPGFTPTSVYAKLIEHAGIAYPELVERLCRLALERRERASAHRY
ncbi:MAG TPA: D-alanine--D-alanine ligase family protein [Solirubrobacteraceae bacterium]|jgi:D-alanine-D-alanine ligase|nr:D-alanine--D-alanine ligase family protein [Solirubrobacteraceae bacterium]